MTEWVGNSPEWIAELDRRHHADPYNREAATLLHDALCRTNHTDGCGWLIETGWADPWADGAHRRWLTVTIGLIDVIGRKGVRDVAERGRPE